MTKFTSILMITVLMLSSQALAQPAVHEIDREVVDLLSLAPERAVAYSTIMQQQRAVYRTLNPRYWAQQKAFYEETFARLKPVLTGEQYIRFLAYMDSFIEATPGEELLVME